MNLRFNKTCTCVVHEFQLQGHTVHREDSEDSDADARLCGRFNMFQGGTQIRNVVISKQCYSYHIVHGSPQTGDEHDTPRGALNSI